MNLKFDREGIASRLSISVLGFAIFSFVGAATPFDLSAQEKTEAAHSKDDAVHKHTNGLINETSPYLLQHAHNPVNWHPWGPAAFAKAKAENKPIFLSVGYSTCYWCHVMERESFEREDVAEILNKHFIAVKVDREERPEVDQQYMLATQLIKRKGGGWPNSVWLTPDGKPWMAGTYFPREQFKQVLVQLADIWTTRNAEILEQADRLSATIERIGVAEMEAKPISQSLIDQSIVGATSRFDSANGGFGSQPKFPPHSVLALLINQYRQNPNPAVLTIIDTTLTKMGQGGVYDQIGDGFHRYSTDGQWLLPHFEKMLYDNGQLMRSYTDGFLLTKKQIHRETVEGIFVWLTREMTSPEGGFYSAIDSESDAEEGKFYIWTYDEILKVLGQEDGKKFADVYRVQPQGNFKDEASGEQSMNNVIHLAGSIDEYAQRHNQDAEQLKKQLSQLRSKLLEVRSQREYPHLDDKIVAAWNGLMIEGLAYAGRQLGEPKYVEAAKKAADFLLSKMVVDGKLKRTYRSATAKLDGYLNDYAFVSSGLLELYRATGDKKYLDAAQQMADRVLADFDDQQGGGFYFTAAPAEGVQTEFIIRSKSLGGGGNLPTGNGVMAQVLFELGVETGDKKYTDAGNQTLSGLSGFMWQTAGQADHLLIAAASSLHPDSLPKATRAASAGQAAIGEKAMDKTAAKENEAATSSDANVADAKFSATSVEGEVYLSKVKLAPGESFRAAVRLGIEDDYHLYGPNPDVEFVLPSTIAFPENNPVAVVEFTPPPGETKMDKLVGEEIAVYVNTVTFFIDLKIPDDAQPGKTKLAFTVKTQACDEEQCSAPAKNEIELELEIVAAPENTAAPRHADIFK